MSKDPDLDLVSNTVARTYTTDSEDYMIYQVLRDNDRQKYSVVGRTERFGSIESEDVLRTGFDELVEAESFVESLLEEDSEDVLQTLYGEKVGKGDY